MDQRFWHGGRFGNINAWFCHQLVSSKWWNVALPTYSLRCVYRNTFMCLHDTYNTRADQALESW